MAANTSPTNHERVIACVAALIGEISHANGNYFDGMVVDHKRDPTAIEMSLPEEYRAKGIGVAIMPGTFNYIPEITAGARRYKMVYALGCIADVTDGHRDDGLGAPAVMARAIEDLQSVLEDDSLIKAKAADLNFSDLGGQRISCMGHKVITARPVEGGAWPTINFDVICEYEYDRRTR